MPRDPNLVTDDLSPDEAAEVHSILGTGGADKQEEQDPELAEGRSILLESGTRCPLGYDRDPAAKDFLITDKANNHYEHVGAHPETGEWTYRKV